MILAGAVPCYNDLHSLLLPIIWCGCCYCGLINGLLAENGTALEEAEEAEYRLQYINLLYFTD